jgi:hypothetical protein
MKLPPQLEAECLAKADRVNGIPVNPPGSVTMGQVFARGRRPKPKDVVPLRLAGFTVLLPVTTISVANGREWRRRVKANQAARREWTLAVARLQLPKLTPPVRIHLVRLGGRKVDPFDNLPCCLKNCVDFLCEWLGVDDGDQDKVTITCDQRPGKGPVGVRVTVEETEETR